MEWGALAEERHVGGWRDRDGPAVRVGLVGHRDLHALVLAARLQPDEAHVLLREQPRRLR